MKVKYILMVLLSSFIGIMSNPEILTASDSVAVFDLERSNMVETKEAPVATKVATVPVAAKAVVAPVKTTPAAPKAGQAAQAKTTKTAVSSTNISFSWGAQNLIFANNTTDDAGQNARKYGRLIWAHNNTPFNNIKTLKIGDTFTVTTNGVTDKYRVSANPIDGKAGVELKVVYGKNSKGEIVPNQFYHPAVPDDGIINMIAMTGFGFSNHSLVLMTCAGSNNAYRYVVVADKI